MHNSSVSEYQSIEDPTFQILANEDQDEVLRKIYGYKSNATNTRLYYLLCILLLGIPYFIIHWYPRFRVIKYTRCSLNIAEFILVEDNHGNSEIISVEMKVVNLPTSEPMNLRYFDYQHTKYVLQQHEGTFVPLSIFIPANSLNNILESSIGLTHIEQQNLLDLYGPNQIEVDVKSYWKLFVEEIFNPFYIFQIFSMLLWCFDDYVIYAVCIFILTLFSVIISLIQTRRQSEALHDLVKSANIDVVEILRPNSQNDIKKYTVDPRDLVPGDVIVIPPDGCIMQCDAVLITGNCIVNESMLTGESVPVTKTPPPSSSDLYDPQIHKRHTIFSGTHVLQTRYYGNEFVLACITRTGFNTTKGALVKSIMYPIPIDLKLYSDSIKFVSVLFIIAAFGMVYSIYLYVNRHAPIKDILMRSIDIVTIVVPPALPAALSVGTAYSQNRLKKLGIYCISPLRINMCGKLKLACFDKTGTLTHDGLEMHSVVPCINAQFIEPVINVASYDPQSRFIQVMATCHSLTRINGKLTGDPLDTNMFESINWDLEEPGTNESARFDMLAPTIVKPQGNIYLNDGLDDFKLPYEIGIVRQFPFSSTQQCMSVIARLLSDPNMLIFTKGAPEKVALLCQKDTLPPDFHDRLIEITAQGFRVIALAYNSLPPKFKWKDAQKVKREIVEHDLIFVGLLIMQNSLKPETAPVISVLQKANIRTVMITGDNIRTAVAVARDCGMIHTYEDVVIINVTTANDGSNIPVIITERLEAKHENNTIVNVSDSDIHFAIDGKTWTNLKLHYPNLVPKLLLRTTIFARFQPDQKTQLILQFEKLDYVVSMVGDGANDCGALKAAHVGVSLSQTEASVAAPFTSSIENISCLLHLILEGRCALVTSFSVFKYMALYSFIQFFSVLILYKLHSLLADSQFLFIDLIIASTITITLGRQGPHHKLVRRRPLGSLVCIKHVIPLTLQIILCVGIQIAALIYLNEQKWFKPLPPGDELVITCWENNVIFCVSVFQYIIVGVVYSKGKPFREPLIRNFWMLVGVLGLTIFITFLMVYPVKDLVHFFNMIYLTHHTKEQLYFRYTLLFFPIIHLTLAVFIETCIFDCLWLKKFVQFITWKKQPRNKYKQLLKETDFSQLLPSL